MEEKRRRDGQAILTTTHHNRLKLSKSRLTVLTKRLSSLQDGAVRGIVVGERLRGCFKALLTPFNEEPYANSCIFMLFHSPLSLATLELGGFAAGFRN